MSDYNQGFPPPGNQGGQGPEQPGFGQVPPQGSPYGQQPPPGPQGPRPGPQGPYGQQDPYGQQVPFNAGFGGPGAPGGASSNNAMVALGLSIGGILVAVFVGVCCILFAPIPILMSGLGAYLGHAELTKIDQGAADPSQRGLAQAAKIVGIVGVALPLLAIAATVVFFGASVFSSGV